MALKSWQASTDKISIRSNPSLLDGIGMDSQFNHEKNKKEFAPLFYGQGKNIKRFSPGLNGTKLQGQKK